MSKRKFKKLSIKTYDDLKAFEKENPNGFSKMSIEISAFLNKVSNAAGKLFVILGSYADFDNSICLTINTLAKLMVLSERTIHNLLKELINIGAIEKIRSRYCVIIRVLAGFTKKSSKIMQKIETIVDSGSKTVSNVITTLKQKFTPVDLTTENGKIAVHYTELMSGRRIIRNKDHYAKDILRKIIYQENTLEEVKEKINIYELERAKKIELNNKKLQEMDQEKQKIEENKNRLTAIKKFFEVTPKDRIEELKNLVINEFPKFFVISEKRMPGLIYDMSQ